MPPAVSRASGPLPASRHPTGARPGRAAARRAGHPRRLPPRPAAGKASCGRRGPWSGRRCRTTVGNPSDLSAKQKQDIANKLRGGSGDLVPWCTDTGVSAGKDYLKRDSACLKWATPIVYHCKVKAPDGNIYKPADAHFASAIEIKLDPVSRKFTSGSHWCRWTRSSWSTAPSACRDRSP